VLLENKADISNITLHGVRHAEVAVDLIEQGVDVNAIDNTGQTALHTTYSAELTAVLIKYGADVNVVDNEERTALDSAAAGNRVEICRILQSVMLVDSLVYNILT